MNKMSINKSNVRSLAAAIVAALILPSCVNLDENQGEGVGYLELPGLTADVEVYELVPTKSGTTTLSELGVTGYNAPDIAAITFNLTGPESYSNTWSGALTEALELPVGTYTLSGEYNNAGNDGLGEALYGDFTTQVTISPQGTVTPEIKLPLANSLVAVSMAKDFDKHFTPDKGDCVTFTSGNASVSAAVGKYVFVPASSKLTVSVKGINSAGVETLTYDDELTSPAAKTACSIVCGLTTTEKAPSVTLASDLSAGAFEDVLYFPAATVENISDANAAKLKYEIKGGSFTDWKEVTVDNVEGKTYKYITGLASGESYSGLDTDVEYRLRARVGNIFSNGNPDGVPFETVTFASCVDLGEVSAKHNNEGDPSLELSSTTMTSSGMKATLPGIIEELTDVTVTGSFNSSKADNATGSFSANLSSTASNVSFTNAEGWPYIPQGTYATEVKATCTLNGKTYEKSSEGNITVPAPEFSVTVSAYTSYDKYAATNNITQNIADANNCDPETLYNAGAKWGISIDLMKNHNYKKKIEIYVDKDATGRIYEVDEYDSNSFYQEVGGLAWKSHTHKVKVTFDNKPEESVETTHHITGLPYSVDFTKSSDITGWYFDGEYKYLTNYSKGYSIRYYYNYWFGTNKYSSNAFSPAFMIPNSAGINCEYSATFYFGETGRETKADITAHIGITSSTSQVVISKSDTFKEYSEFLTTSAHVESVLTNTGTLHDKNRISISTSEADYPSTTEHYGVLGKTSVKYSSSN